MTFSSQQPGSGSFQAPAGNQNPDIPGVDQFTPSSSGENAFIQESQGRMNRLHEQDRTMIENDRQMMKKGYDPNEIPPQYKTPVKDQKQQPHWNPPRVQTDMKIP